MPAPRTRTPKKEDFTSTYWIVCIAACVLTLGWTWYAARELERDEKILTEPAAAPLRLPMRAWIELDFGDGRKRIFEGVVNHNRYLLTHSLQSAAQEARLKFSFRDGTLIRIGNAGNPSGVWNIYRNGKKITGHLATLMIKAGDRYTFRFERNQ